MEIRLAESAGFCYGVKRALDTVAEAAGSGNKPMFTLGPLIHNPQTIEKLEQAGVKSISDLRLVSPGSIIVMPTHGVPKQVIEQAHDAGLEIIDVTCPFVANVHRLAEQLVSEGYQILVLGDEGHTEVRGLMSRAGDDAVVISNDDDLSGVTLKKHIGILAQTTQSVERYKNLVGEVAGRAYEVRAYNTICNATMERQHEALKVAREVDVMIVVGGRNSANTRRLSEICAETDVPTHHVELAEEILPDWFATCRLVGITAGASTPDWIIDEVIKRIKSIAVEQ